MAYSDWRSTQGRQNKVCLLPTVPSELSSPVPKQNKNQSGEKGKFKQGFRDPLVIKAVW